MLKAIPTLCLQGYFALTRGGGGDSSGGFGDTTSGDTVSTAPSLAGECLACSCRAARSALPVRARSIQSAHTITHAHTRVRTWAGACGAVDPTALAGVRVCGVWTRRVRGRRLQAPPHSTAAVVCLATVSPFVNVRARPSPKSNDRAANDKSDFSTAAMACYIASFFYVHQQTVSVSSAAAILSLSVVIRECQSSVQC